jgi:4-amino-4-deoxy-L-arabinose transferase-like glycosyltransferase
MTAIIKKKLLFICLIFITIFGGFLRYTLITDTHTSNPIRGDAAKYTAYAYNLKNYGVYSIRPLSAESDPTALKPDAIVTPGYPLFLVPFVDQRVTAFSQENYKEILLAQGLLSTITVLMTYFLFARILNPTTGLVAALLTALSPHLINMNVYVLTETLFCFLLIGFFFVLSHKSTPNKSILLALAGILLGAATLTRSWPQGFAFLLFLYMIFSERKIPLQKAVFLLFGFGLLVGPWLVRNFMSFGFFSDPTLSITSIYHGSFPGMTYYGRLGSFGFAYHFDPRAYELSHSFPILRAEIINHFHSDPWTYIKWYAFGKVPAVFAWSISGGVGDIYQYPMLTAPFAGELWLIMIHDFMQLIHGAVTAIGILACFLVWLPARFFTFPPSGRFLARSISILFFYFMILIIIGAPYSRYSIPLRPLLYGMMVVGVNILYRIFFPKLRSFYAVYRSKKT